MGNLVLGSCLSPDGCKNLFCIGKEPCKPCYCMLEEEHRVGRVFDHFEGQPVGTATKQAGQLGVYVGRVTLPDNPQQIGVQQCCYSPGTQKPCVYWRVVVEEEWVRWRRVEDFEDVDNGEGGTERVKVGEHWESYKDWDEIVDKENSVDFYLQDGATKIFVHGSKRDDVRIQSDWDGGGSNRSWIPFAHTQLPEAIQWLVNTHATQFGGWAREWFTGSLAHMSVRPPDMPTGNFRYEECKFEVNEKLACLGVASSSYNDPYTQTIAMALIPVVVGAIGGGQMSGWSRWDKWSWTDLMKDDADGTVLLTDDEKYTRSVDVAPVVNLPRWQTVLVVQHTPWGEQQVVGQATVAAPQQLVGIDTDGDGAPDTVGQVVQVPVPQPAVIQQQPVAAAQHSGATVVPIG